LKAIQIVAPSKLKFIECASRPLKKHEIRINVAFSCICGSDFKNIASPVKIPEIPGHEFSGKVIETSPQSKKLFKLGERVTVFPMMGCMRCFDCGKQNYRDCKYKLSLGFQIPGAFAEEVIVDGRFAIPLLEGISYEQGALLEHLCCGLRLMKEISLQRLPSEDVHILIVGDGPIALADVQALKINSYSNITLIGKHKNRKNCAKKLGVLRVVDVTNLVDALPDLPPVDICILAADAEEVLTQIIPLMTPSSIFYPQSRVKSSSIQDLLKINKISFGRAFAYFLEDFEEMMALICAKKIDTDSLITTRVSLSNMVDMFQGYHNKNDIKVLIANKNFESALH
jgi:threonine dehydrogenase-like Zn-dependent dehydrogenase